MTKTIIFCADGTWNGPDSDDDNDGSPDPTNVFKLFCNLAGSDTDTSLRLANEQEREERAADGTLVQIAKYLHGVGDSKNPLVKLLGGGAGAGLIARLVRGYTFISRNYEPGDGIFLVGFSRGAYTVRALAGLINARGVIDAQKEDLQDKRNAYRLGSAVWQDYRQQAVAGNDIKRSRLNDLIEELPRFFSRNPTPNLVPDVEISAVAVWDTVGAYGIPDYDRQKGRLDAFEFADRKLSRAVQRGLHAIAIDEQRDDFVPTLWDADQRIMQVLFSGAHADVGGGYTRHNKESGLSDIALDWMTAELGQLGLRWSPTPTYPPAPASDGVAHEPWRAPPWSFLPQSPRRLPHGLAVHRSVIQRIDLPAQTLEQRYMPVNLAHYLDQDGKLRSDILMI